MVRLSPFHYHTKSFMLAQNRQSTNIHWQNQNSTSIRDIIYFIHTSLRYRKGVYNWNRLRHMVGIACDWLTPQPAAVFHSFWPGRNWACPGNTRHEKEREILNAVTKTERLGTARARAVTNENTTFRTKFDPISNSFSAQQHAERAICHRLSVCLSGTRVDQ